MIVLNTFKPNKNLPKGTSNNFDFPCFLSYLCTGTSFILKFFLNDFIKSSVSI